jgi:alpha-1,6-mannosyltransferase
LIFADLTYTYNEVSGGIRTYIDARRKYILDHTDWTHVLIVPGEEDGDEKSERTRTIRIASPIMPGSAPYRFFVRPDKIVAALTDAAPDAIEVGSLFVAPWTAFRYRRKHPVSLFGFYHTDLPDGYVRPVARRIAGDAIGNWASDVVVSYVKRVLSGYDVALAASGELVTKLNDLGVGRVEHVQLGVDLDMWHPRCRDAGVRPELGISESSLVLIYSGRIDVEKKVRVLCDTVERLPDELDPVLVLVGQGPLEQEMRSRAEKSSRLRMLPYERDKAQLARVMASADLYLAGNPAETFGLAVVEAQACGLPVVGVRSGALIDRVLPEIGELCEPNDSNSMADAIVRIVSRPDWSQMRAAARQHVAARFSWESSFERLFLMYEDEVAARRGSK